MSCMCGAWDCKSCRPENFYKGVYINDWDEFDKDRFDAYLENKAVDEYEDYKDWIDNQGDTGRGE